MIIQIDYREHCDKLKEVLCGYGFQLDIKPLKIGDYIIQPDTVVERKTIRDFCISILDGRLFSQAYRLVNLEERAILMIEGESFTKNIPVDIGIKQIKGVLITLAQTFHLPILRTLNQEDSAWHLKQLAMQRKRLGQNKGSLHSYTPKKQQTKKEYILRGLPGIGSKLAKELLEEFGSIKNIINASPEALSKINGLGDKKIKEIHDILREEQSEYVITTSSDFFL